MVVGGTVGNRDETSDGLDTGRTPFRKKFAVTIGTVRLFVLRREPLASQRNVAVGTAKAFPVPRLVLVGHTASAYHLHINVNLELSVGKRKIIAKQF